MLETTYNVDAIDTALSTAAPIQYLAVGADAALTPQFEAYRFDQLRASPSGIPFTPRENGGTFSVPVPLRGGVGTTFEPLYGLFFEIAGMVKSNPDAVSTLYTSAGVFDKSATIYRYYRNTTDDEFRLQVATGCQGNFTIAGTAGEEAVLTPTGPTPSYPDISGVPAAFFDTSGDPALLKNGTTSIAPYGGAVTLDNGSKMRCVSQSIVVDGTVYPLSAWSLDHGVQATPVPTVNSADGIGCVAVSRSGNVTLNLALEACDGEVALNEILTAYRAGSEVNLAIGLANDVCEIVFDFPAIQFTMPTMRDQGGQAGWDVGAEASGDFTANKFGGNDYTILYKAAS